jgi:hypothetical protein
MKNLKNFCARCVGAETLHAGPACIFDGGKGQVAHVRVLADSDLFPLGIQYDGGFVPVVDGEGDVRFIVVWSSVKRR